eukprot:gene39109-48301_t
MAQYVFSMNRVGKIVPPKRHILKDISLIFDSHWFTTGYHLVDGGEKFEGSYISDEMPWYLNGVPYSYLGCPDLAVQVEAVSRERKGYVRNIRHPELGKQYATINLVKHLHMELSKIPVLTVSSCQNCEWPQFLQSGEDIGEAIRRSDLNVVLLASGALSHKFNGIDWRPNHPRIFHESNVSRPENIESDKAAIELMRQGRHDEILALAYGRPRPMGAPWTFPTFARSATCLHPAKP